MTERDFDKEELELDAKIADMLGKDSGNNGDAVPDSPDSTASSDSNSNDPVGEVVKAATSAETDSSFSDDYPKTNDGDAEREEIKNAKRRMHQATTEAAELRKENARLAEMLHQLQSSQVTSADKSIDSSIAASELAQLMDDFPELAEPIIKHNKMLEAKLAEKLAAFEEQMTSVKSMADRFSKSEAESFLERHVNAIKSAHPDADNLVFDDAFQDWADLQPPMIKQALENGTSDDVIMALTLYKQATKAGLPLYSKEDKLAAARAASNPSVPRTIDKPQDRSRSFTREQIKSMSINEFLKNEEAIDRAMMSGSIM